MGVKETEPDDCTGITIEKKDARLQKCGSASDAVCTKMMRLSKKFDKQSFSNKVLSG